eukprot:282844-Prorocentrum_minimum.AAC.1
MSTPVVAMSTPVVAMSTPGVAMFTPVARLSPSAPPRLARERWRYTFVTERPTEARPREAALQFCHRAPHRGSRVGGGGVSLLSPSAPPRFARGRRRRYTFVTERPTEVRAREAAALHFCHQGAFGGRR